uniref:Max-binding protein MNT n=1 Tax=Zeugodacus cucurbitae TaxID=28588 RepID=A0A0A1XA12_ZEUCU
MSTGLKVLLDAAQYIEHQEKLKRSPTTDSNGSVEDSYISQCSTGFDIANGVRNNNNNVMNAKNTRSIADLVQVSTSAPAASTTFHHIKNGVIITNNNSSLTGSQLLVEMKPSQRKQNNNRNMSEYDGTIDSLKTSPKIINSSKLLSIQTNTTTDNAVNETCISEDAFSSNSKSSPTLNGLAALFSIQPNVRCSNEQEEHLRLPATEEELSKGNNGHYKKSKAYRLVDSDSCDIVVVTAAANKQMLLNDGLRVASPAANTYSIPSKAISIPKQVHQHHSVASKFSLINSTSAPQSILYKSSEPLTPPPIACRKVDETHSRIRSFSLSHKIPANQPPLKNGELGKMILEDGTALQCIEGDESLTRHNSTGSHYLQMMSAQHSATSTPLMHLTPTISASGRRRTISSNSNGAGTREVHNKLEKNRRAHLKECYEQLKNQLPLKEDERKKTSNLAILGEAIKYVKTLKKKDQELEAEVEQLAKMKINSQLKLVSLKRELGPKYEQMFPGPFLDFDINNFEKDNSNETASLSSGRGSILYSSSSSLSSGGSNGSTTMSSPVGASMPQPSALSPVISKACINNNISSSVNGNNSSSNINVTAKSPAMFEHKQQIKSSASISDYTSPTGMSPTNTNVALANRSITNVSSAALSLTAKNISAMSLTRDSPTPSTPSPSPSSSSCISSSSSLISSSPPRPLNGIISGRSVTVSIPNNVKFASSGLGTSRVITPVTGSAIVNATSSTTATILSASSPSNGVNSTNNAIMLQALRGCHLV